MMYVSDIASDEEISTHWQENAMDHKQEHAQNYERRLSNYVGCERKKESLAGKKVNEVGRGMIQLVFRI